ncbi:hypothetical protein JYP51_02020 [Ponticoccus gilvus]|nr:hypothetical protein [Enemella evansiae]
MENPSELQKIMDHLRAFVWAGRPVSIRYLDRNSYFRDPAKFGGGEEIVDGNCTVRIGVSTVRIFLPIEVDRLDTLRHECGHVRYHFVPRPSAALSEARRLFRVIEPEDAALYDARGEGFDMSGEAVVRLADRARAGHPMPSMSTPLAELVQAVVAPARASAMGFVFLLGVLAALAAWASTVLSLT